jgi:hypothetical protein
MTLSSAYYWTNRLKCPGDPILGAKLTGENVAESIASKGHMLTGLSEIFKGLNLFNYVQLVVPTNVPMSFWLPSNQFSDLSILIAAFCTFTIWSVAIPFAIVTLARFVLQNGLSSRHEPRVLIALVVFGCVLVWGASQIHRNDYEALHILPMLVLFCVLCLSLPTSENSAARLLSVVARLAAGGATITSIIVLSSLASPLFAAAKTPGYVSDQPFSVSIASYSQIRKNIGAAMIMADFPRDRRLHRLLIDDTTYLALQGSYLPLHRLGVLSVSNGSITDPVAYLRSRRSDGIVVGCRYLPPDLLRAASRSGPICAISANTLDILASAKSHSRP